MTEKSVMQKKYFPFEVGTCGIHDYEDHILNRFGGTKLICSLIPDFEG